jgi:glycosyltransferase involved in cell wall biosynthesis
MPESRYSLMFPSWYPNRENPLSGIFTKKHIAAIDQFIPTYTLFVLPTNKIKSLRIEKEKTEKEEIIYFGTTKISLINAVLFVFIYSFSILFILLKRGKPAFIHNHVVFPSGFVALITAKVLNVKLLITEHWSGYLIEDNRFYKLNILTQRGIRYILASAHKIGLVSNFMKKRLIETHFVQNSNVIITPNIIETNDFIPEERKAGNEINVLTICNLNDEEKNISGMIDAIYILNQNSLKPIKLSIIGDGPDEEMLKQKADSLYLLNSKIFFLGRIDNKLLTNYYAKYDFYLLNSNFETLNISAIEALMHGLPVVASKCGGPEDYLTEKNSIQVNTQDTNDLVRGIKEMIEKQETLNRREIKSEIEKLYNEKVVMESLKRLYD